MINQSSSLSIRKATLHDVVLIKQLAYDTWPSAYGNILSPEALQYMLNYFYSEEALKQQMQQGQTFYVAETAGKAIGFGAVSEYEQAIYKLNKLYVLPNLQKTGAGKALLQYGIEISKAAKAKQLILNVNRYNPAKDFYQRMGFTILKEEDVDLGNGIVQEDYVMGLAIV